MIGFFRSNGIAGLGVVIPSLILFFLILLFVSSPAISVPTRPFESEYNRQNLFPEKFFLNIDNGLITLIARDNPLEPILEEISSRIGVKIRISPAIRSKKITVRWKDLSFKDGVKKLADDSGLFFGKDEAGNLYLSESQSVPETGGQSFEEPVKAVKQDVFKNTSDEEQPGISPSGIDSSETLFSQDKDLENNIVLNEVVIRFKPDISEQDINKFLSDAHIKVKKYIAALKFHILSLPEGMSYYDAMALFKNKKMIYQQEQNYLFPVK